MFGFRSKQADVLDHWYTPVPNFVASAQDFYVAIEKVLKEQQVPGLEISRVEFSEGGALSQKRIYLRMVRERLVFDICAAPFGTNFFYSCRFAEIPAVVKLWEILVLGIALFFGTIISFYVFVRLFGILAAFIWTSTAIGVLIAVIYILRNAVSMGLKDLDASLIQTPVIGPVYEAWFRRDSYYRQDTRLMYLTVVEGIVKKLVEEETAAKGLRLLTIYESGPILHELYKPRPFGVDAEKKETG